MLKTIPLIVSGLLSLATAVPTSYPQALLTTFYIERFTLFNPTGANTNPPEITFTYYDPTTNITTPCIYNGVVDPTVSYPCSNTAVSFQWNKTSSTLSVEETLAPEEEIFGSIGIGTYCYPIEPPVLYGYGTECQPPGDGGSLSGSFTNTLALYVEF